MDWLLFLSTDSKGKEGDYLREIFMLSSSYSQVKWYLLWKWTHGSV